MSSPRETRDWLLSRLRRELRHVGWGTRRRALHEARDHLLCAIDEEIARGASAGEAEKRAVDRFGDPVEVAARMPGASHAWLCRALPVAVGAVVVTGVLALPAGPVRESFTSQQARAAVPQRMSTARCAKAWNAEANARWRAYAVRQATRRAWIGGSISMNPKDGEIIDEICVVKLWLEPRAGHWQNAIYIYGAWGDGTAEYGTSWNQEPATPHRVRLRTTTQWSNARVQPDGAVSLHVGTSS